MVAENKNVPMVVDGETAEEIYTADATAEALNEAVEEGDFPTAAEMVAFEAIVTPRNELRSPQPTGSFMSPPAASSRANSPSASNNSESVSLKPVVSSSRDVAGIDEVADSLRVALALAVNGSALHTSFVAALDLHLLSIARKSK